MSVNATVTKNVPILFLWVNQIKINPKKPMINKAGKGMSKVAMSFFSSNIDYVDRNMSKQEPKYAQPFIKSGL